MAQAMSTDEALKIVLELAEQNVLTDHEVDDERMHEEQQRQIRAVAIVRVAFRIT